MKNLIKKFVTCKNIFGLLYIMFYFVYVGVSMYLNHGNNILNIILLILTSTYLLLYIYSVFIESNKRIKRSSRKIFIRSKKFIGFVNAIMILTSVFANEENSMFTIILAILTIMWFIVYMAIDIASTIALYEFKKYTEDLGWKYDNRN